MRSIKAVFKKEIKDFMSNTGVLIQFAIFPITAFAMTMLVARGNDDIPDTMFVTMMAMIFVGMGLIPSVTGIVAEDRERKSLRFLVMAGVSPFSYLFAISGVIFFVSLLPAFAFAFMGELSGAEFWIFMAAMMSGVIASTFLGLTIGICAKNQQAAIGLSMPFAMIFGFVPMIAGFNEPMMRFTRFMYTQQIDLILGNVHPGGFRADMSLWESFGIIGLNVVVMAALFVVAFAKKGLKS